MDNSSIFENIDGSSIFCGLKMFDECVCAVPNGLGGWNGGNGGFWAGLGFAKMLVVVVCAVTGVENTEGVAKTFWGLEKVFAGWGIGFANMFEEDGGTIGLEKGFGATAAPKTFCGADKGLAKIFVLADVVAVFPNMFVLCGAGPKTFAAGPPNILPVLLKTLAFAEAALAKTFV